MPEKNRIPVGNNRKYRYNTMLVEDKIDEQDEYLDCG